MTANSENRVAKPWDFDAAPIGKTCFLGSYSSALLITGNFRRPACPGCTCKLCSSSILIIHDWSVIFFSEGRVPRTVVFWGVNYLAAESQSTEAPSAAQDSMPALGSVSAVVPLLARYSQFGPSDCHQPVRMLELMFDSQHQEIGELTITNWRHSSETVVVTHNVQNQ